MSFKIVYIILVHTNYEQTMRLYHQLDGEDSTFVFHISENCEAGFYEKMVDSLKNQQNCYFTKRAYVIWGGFGMVQGALNAIETICENQIRYDYALLLSGQDYPIQPQIKIFRTLENANGKQFLEIIPFSKIDDFYKERIETSHFWIGNRHFWYPHENRKSLIVKLFDFLASLFFPKVQKIPYGYIPYKGSFWWNMTRDCVEFFYQHVRSHEGRELIRFFKHTHHPSEAYFQTILMNSEFKDRIVNNDLRYINWPEGPAKGRPQLITVNDFEGIAVSKRLFGRKFDMSMDAQILDMIDEKILSS